MAHNSVWDCNHGESDALDWSNKFIGIVLDIHNLVLEYPTRHTYPFPPTDSFFDLP